MKFLRMGTKLINLDNVKCLEMNEELKIIIVEYTAGGVDITVLKEEGQVKYVFDKISDHLMKSLTKASIVDNIQNQSNGDINNES